MTLALWSPGLSAGLLSPSPPGNLYKGRSFTKTPSHVDEYLQRSAVSLLLSPGTVLPVTNFPSRPFVTAAALSSHLRLNKGLGKVHARGGGGREAQSQRDLGLLSHLFGDSQGLYSSQRQFP